jgi:hypothetical protein
MQYSLTGFTLEAGCRVFAFQSVEPHKVRTTCKVRIDLALARNYGIMVQELPLLCLELLARQEGVLSALTFTEDDMRANANVRAADKEEALRRKSMRKVPPRRPSADPMEQNPIEQSMVHSLVAEANG